jgi:cell wall-associated NlpC family hydrolase
MVNPEYADLIGKPFVRAGRGPDGYDCYGLVREMFRRIGKETPNYTTGPEGATGVAQILSGIREWKKVDYRPGVMVLFKLPTTLHVGFTLPYGKVIHTWDTSGGVCVERFEEWKLRAIGYYEY